jgi:hypothetical protein
VIDMRKLTFLLLWSLLSIQTLHAGGEVYLPNLKKNATGTTSGSNSGIDVNIIGGTLSASEVAIAGNGSSLPTYTKVVSGYDGSNVRVIKTDSGGAVQVDVESSALPSGAATSAKQDTMITSLSNIDTDTSSIITNTGTTATNTTSIDGKINANYGAAAGAIRTASQIGNATAVADFNAGNASAQTLRTVIATDQSAIPASQSGTWNVTNISGTVSLPTGAATALKQDTGNTSLGTIDTSTAALNGKVANNYGAASGAVRTASQIGNATAVADFNAGNASAQTLRTVIATDQSAIPATQSGTWSHRTQDGSGNAITSSTAGSTRPLDVSVRDSSGNLISPVTYGTSGSQSNSTVSTVITLTAPAGAMGFLLTNLDTSTANIRWAVGATATASVGTQLQPGRDTGFFPVGGNISVCAESGTQNYSVQWIIR